MIGDNCILQYVQALKWNRLATFLTRQEQRMTFRDLRVEDLVDQDFSTSCGHLNAK